MSSCQVFEQSIQIKASATTVERCITDLELMRRWLNPVLVCEPIGDWKTDIGGRSRFLIQIPLIQPTLKSTVIEREPLRFFFLIAHFIFLLDFVSLSILVDSCA